MRTRRRPHATRHLAGVLVLALLCAQWLGVAHAIAHSPAQAVEIARADHDDHGDHWGHDADTAVCQVVDHLLCGQAIGDALAPLSPQRRAGPVAPPRRQPVPPGLAPCPYEARGPPTHEVPRAC